MQLVPRVNCKVATSGFVQQRFQTDPYAGVGAADGLQSNTLETMLLTEEQLNRLDHVTTDHLPENDLAMMFEAAPDVVSVELETCRQQQQAASAPPPPGMLPALLSVHAGSAAPHTSTSSCAAMQMFYVLLGCKLCILSWNLFGCRS